MTTLVFNKYPRLKYWGCLIFTGIIGGIGGTGYTAPFLWLFAFFPLLIILDQVFQGAAPRWAAPRNHEISWKKKLIHSLLACCITGVIMATFGAQFIVNSVHVYGHMPWLVGVFIASFGYGLEVGLVLWSCFALPLFFVKQWTGWDIPFRWAFALVVDLYYPRIFQWSFGGYTFAEVPWISQVADLIGSWGLGFYTFGFNLLLLLLWRSTVAKQTFNLILVKRLYLGFAFLVLVGTIYGGWRTDQIHDSLSEGKSLQITSIQPNFSFQRLASNPELAGSTREGNIKELLNDSQKALSAAQRDPSTPHLVIWPESVYPDPFFKKKISRQRVQEFAQKYETSILLSSVDYERVSSSERPSGYQFYGTSVLIGSDGKINGRYNKIFLMPFGEYIPGASIFPAFRKWLKSMIPNISEFEAGDEYTVFNIDDLQLSGTICYDVFSPSIARNMVLEGAEIIINLSNLAWFGTSNAADQMELAIRWQAIENRVPFVIASNNGESLLIDVLGNQVGGSLGLFEEGSLTETIKLQPRFSFYRDYTNWVYLGVVIILFLSIILGHSKGRVFSAEGRPNDLP